MTREHLEAEESPESRLAGVAEALAVLNHGLPSAPGLGVKGVAAYNIALRELPVPVIKAAAVRALETWDKATILPTPGVLRRLAIEILAEWDGIPSAEDAWLEARAKITRYGVLGVPRQGGGYDPIVWSHPMVEQVVEIMGGVKELSDTSNRSVDRAHWIKTVYPAVLSQWDRKLSGMAHRMLIAKELGLLEDGNG